MQDSHNIQYICLKLNFTAAVCQSQDIKVDSNATCLDVKRQIVLRMRSSRSESSRNMMNTLMYLAYRLFTKDINLKIKNF